MPNRLRTLREQRQAAAADANEWSQASVAAMVRVSEATYWAWENGRRRPLGYHQVRLAEAFGVTRDELGFEKEAR